MTLKLIGNATRDTIFRGGFRQDPVEKLGGVHTIARHLRVPHEDYFTKDSSVDVFMGFGGEKARSTWQSLYKDIEEPEEWPHTAWSHISYLELVNLDMKKIRDSSDNISADLCGGMITNVDLWLKMRFVDYLIVDVDQWFNLRSIINPNRTIVIARSRDKVYWGQDEFPNRYIQVQNVVGAGDVFVAEFLNCMVDQYMRYHRMMSLGPKLEQAEIIERCVNASIEYLKAEGNPWADTISLSQ